MRPWQATSSMLKSTPNTGPLAGRQQEPLVVHGSFLQLSYALPPAKERAWSSGSGNHDDKPQALPQGNWQEADKCG